MLATMRRLVGAGALSLASGMAAGSVKAYPVDCAILLCLAGGWPASAECVHAKAVFIQRATPWPIQPPLQIWRCPMGSESGIGTLSGLRDPRPEPGPESGADIDISDRAFDFVRSIRVWDVRHYSHRKRNDDCEEWATINLGVYGPQGEFEWERTTPDAAPSWVLPTRQCGWASTRRGVGVEWKDHEGTHSVEWVSY